MEFVLSIERWIHFLSGVTWIGLLYYFNFVQVPAIAEANADKGGPGPAAINKYVAPRALLWFRWAAVVTWISGALYLMGSWGFVDAFTLGAMMDEPSKPVQIIGVGAWLGTIMLINVWVLIWPNQKKVLGIVAASDDEKNRRAGRRCSHHARTRCSPSPCFSSWAGHPTGCRSDSTLRGGGGPFRSPPPFGVRAPAPRGPRSERPVPRGMAVDAHPPQQ